MYVDPVKMKAARDRKALTQEALAHKARVNVRTIQRAESGHPIQAETLANIAAELGVPASALVRPSPTKEQEVLASETEETQTQVLKRIESAETIVATLERSTMAVLGCTAEPTPETMPSLRQIIQELERLIHNPWDHEEVMPLSFGSLLQRLDTVVSLNKALAEIEQHGMALYLATSTAYVKIPYMVEEGFRSTNFSQKPEYVMAARFMIAEYHSERIRISSDVQWPLAEEPAPVNSWGRSDWGTDAGAEGEIPF